MRLARYGFALLSLTLAFTSPAVGCFGTELKVGVAGEGALALGGYAAGYWIEEKTGVPPKFVAQPDAGTKMGEEVDLLLLPAGTEGPPDAVSRDGIELGGRKVTFWIRKDVLEDLRFFTVDRAIKLIKRLYGAESFAKALAATGSAKKNARRAVLDAE